MTQNKKPLKQILKGAIGAKKTLWQTDQQPTVRLTNRPINRRTDRVIGKLYFQKLSYPTCKHMLILTDWHNGRSNLSFAPKKGAFLNEKDTFLKLWIVYQLRIYSKRPSDWPTHTCVSIYILIHIVCSIQLISMT